ncbi:fas-binding factor 1 homolog [Eupeodes corollae]|uniref:fas-binding factor 1 homolog n=1 Tax=Eupeodes corollae TaxID=290404 RepID=UPI002491CF29|nr:fas-binding factor 1 homolog [Eupeodes corollae]
MRNYQLGIVFILLAFQHISAEERHFHEIQNMEKAHKSRRSASDVSEDMNKEPQTNCQSRNMLGSQKQKASSIALKAAQEAKAASNAQTAAGQQAAHQVKAQLAEKALQAARAAEAALSGKQGIVEQLEKEVREAEEVVHEETASMQNTQNNVNAAMQAAQQATTLLRTLTQAVQTAQANVGNSEQAALGAQQELSEKTQLLEAAKNRVEQLLRQLSEARTDFASTKQAAYKASASAHEAKLNAAKNRRRRRINRLRRTDIKGGNSLEN